MTTTKTSAISKIAFAAVLAAAMAMPFSATAETACPAFPTINFWGDLTHDTVRQHVEAQMAGDWYAYVEQLERQQATLKNIHKRGSGAVISRDDQKIKLTGDNLARYLKFGDQRLAVIRCLANESDIAGLGNFATAAGTPANAPVAKPKAARGKDMERTFMTLPKDLLEKLRKIAVRRSVTDARKTSVDDVVVEILERELKKRNR